MGVMKYVSVGVVGEAAAQTESPLVGPVEVLSYWTASKCFEACSPCM